MDRTERSGYAAPDAPRHPSLVTQMIVAERYGLRLSIEQLAECLGLTKAAVYNAVSADRFPILTYMDAGKRWADYRDVAAHFDACRDKAKEALRSPSKANPE